MMNPGPGIPPITATVERATLRRWSVAALVALIIAVMHGGAQALPVWMLLVPFVLFAVMDVIAAGEIGRPADSATQIRPLANFAATFAPLLFHGTILVTVVSLHDEMRQRGDLMTNAGRTLLASTMSGGCESAAGGCGSGGCGAGGGTVASAASGAKSACGCGSGAKAGGAVAAAMPNASQMRPGLPPMAVRQNGMVPGVTNQPVSISPQAMAVIAAQSKTTIPRPGQVSTMKLPVPMNARTEANRSLPGSTIAPPTNAPSTRPRPLISAPKEDAPKETKESQNREPGTGNP